MSAERSSARLMVDACRRPFDAILVWKIDRFGRSLRHLVISLAKFAALGMVFFGLRDNLDLSTPSGRLMFQIIEAMAEFERGCETLVPKERGSRLAELVSNRFAA